MKSVPDFLEDHIGDREVLVLGMNPSTRTKPFKNGTFVRLKSWMDSVGIPHWDFHNVIPEKTGEPDIADVDWETLKEKIKGRKVVICLGTFVVRVMSKLVNVTPDWPCRVIAIDHPSPRNRKFNDPAYEPEMLRRLKKELEKELKSTGPQGCSCPCGFHGDDFCKSIGCPRD